MPKTGTVSGGDEVEGEVAEPDDRVRDREGEGVVTEGLRDAEGDDDETDHGAEHGEPDGALFGFDEVGQPGVADPRPPEDGEDEHRVAEPGPRGMRRHERGALGEAEDEDEVEEQLEWLHRSALAQLEAPVRRRCIGTFGRAHGFSGRRDPARRAAASSDADQLASRSRAA